jgi:hypothetical protein
MTTRDKVDEAFELLKKSGYFAEQDYYCCQTCAWSSIPDELCDKVVFYHSQDNDAWRGDELKDILHLAWNGDSEEIVGILRSVGLSVSHDGEESTRIKILP